jgi:hypothetical protein
MIGTDRIPSGTGVERTVRRLMGAVVILLLVVGILVMFQFLPASEIRARKLAIVDDAGRERVLIHSLGQDVSLTLFGTDGAPLVVITTTTHGGVVQLQDGQGRDRLLLNGSERPSVMFFGDKGPYVPWALAGDE